MNPVRTPPLHVRGPLDSAQVGLGQLVWVAGDGGTAILGAGGGAGSCEHQMNVSPELIFVRRHVGAAVLAAVVFLVLERQWSTWHGCWPCKPTLQRLMLWFVFVAGCQLKRWQTVHTSNLCVCCPVAWSVWSQNWVQVFSSSLPYQQEREGYFLYLLLFSRQMPLGLVVEQESCDSSCIKSRSSRNGPKRGRLWCCRPGFWPRTMVTEEDRMCCRPLVPKDRKQCHNQVFGEIRRVESAMTSHARSAFQVSSLPEAHYRLFNFTLALLHSLYSSYSHTVSLLAVREMQQRQTLSFSCAFSSQVTARSGRNMWITTISENCFSVPQNGDLCYPGDQIP